MVLGAFAVAVGSAAAAAVPAFPLIYLYPCVVYATVLFLLAHSSLHVVAAFGLSTITQFTSHWTLWGGSRYRERGGE